MTPRAWKLLLLFTLCGLAVCFVADSELGIALTAFSAGASTAEIIRAPKPTRKKARR